jgi:hypothetical protein
VTQDARQAWNPARRLHRRVACAAIACAAMLMPSCGFGPPSTIAESTRHRPPEPMAPERVAAHEPPLVTDSELAAQARRDMEIFLQMQAEADPARGEANRPAAAAGMPGTPRPPGPAIRWNERAAGAAIELRGERPAGAAVGAGPSPARAAAQKNQPREPEAHTPPAAASPPDPEAAPPVLAILPPVEPAANPHPSPRSLDDLLADLRAELYARAGHADMPLRELFLIAAMRLLGSSAATGPGESRPALDPELVEGLSARERELLGMVAHFFDALGRGLDGTRDAEEVLMQQVAALRTALAAEPPLAVPEVRLCTRVGGFGDFTPFEKNVFLAHTEQQAVVYVEVEHFSSAQSEAGQWTTALSQSLTIYAERDGIPVWMEEWQDVRDVTQHRRHDFFIVQVITLPEALSVGRYHLKVRVRDEATGAEAENAIPFEMVADARLAATPK